MLRKIINNLIKFQIKVQRSQQKKNKNNQTKKIF